LKAVVVTDLQFAHHRHTDGIGLPGIVEGVAGEDIGAGAGLEGLAGRCAGASADLCQGCQINSNLSI